MKENWVVDQTLQGIAQFDRAMIEAYPDSNTSLQSASDYLRTVGEVCNYLDAANVVDWERYLPPEAVLLDLGCGGGWLAAILSRFDQVKTIYALDSSRHFLHRLLPRVIELKGGRSDKITVIEGLFQPLLFEDELLDVVVASSALHHAENLESVLREIRRVLKPGGALFILNETPRRGFRYMLSVALAAFRILRDQCLRTYRPLSPAISSSGYLYDPKLGDRDYPQWYWEAALKRAGFSLDEVMNTGLPTLRNGRGRSLIHFVSRAV